MRPSESEVLQLLRGQGVPEEVISHTLKVETKAREISLRIQRTGVGLDPELVRLGALVHDIGRSQSHSLDHGLIGAEILRTSESCRRMFGEADREALAKMCERHIGGGIPASFAARVGLPERDFIPRSLEEKIVAHADNLVWNGVLTLEESRRAFVQKFGKNSPVVKRVIELGNEMEELAGRALEGDHDTGEDLQKSPRGKEKPGRDAGRPH